MIGRGWEINGGSEEVNAFISKMYDDLPMDAVFEDALSAFWLGSNPNFSMISPAKKGPTPKIYVRAMIRRFLPGTSTPTTLGMFTSFLVPGVRQ